MTFRDTSADTTLDNANMGMREDFDTWADKEEYAQMTEERSAAHSAWGARQPEIDALKHRFEEANKLTVEWMEKCKELKAENERLRNDADRYRWIRYRTSGIAADETGVWIFNFPTLVYKDRNPCNTAAENLDYTIDAAMKDFSTTEKEGEKAGLVDRVSSK